MAWRNWKQKKIKQRPGLRRNIDKMCGGIRESNNRQRWESVQVELDKTMFEQDKGMMNITNPFISLIEYNWISNNIPEEIQLVSTSLQKEKSALELSLEKTLSYGKLPSPYSKIFNFQGSFGKCL
jgi:hypothetical protein